VPNLEIQRKSKVVARKVFMLGTYIALLFLLSVLCSRLSAKEKAQEMAPGLFAVGFILAIRA
jgi:hypothetical protein